MTTLTDRYVMATLSRLPEAKRADIERELRASIADAVDGRIEAGDEAAAAEYAVLRDLGDPARLAAGYADRPQMLIGPAYYLDYTRLLTTLAIIVLPIVAAVVVVAQTFKNASFWEVIGTTAGATISTAAHLFCWVTLAFAAIERGRVGNPLGDQKWTPESLPEGPPSRRARFGELVAITVFTAIFVAGLLLSPSFSSVKDAAGEPIGLLDPWLWETGAIYGFIAILIAGLIVRYLRFYLGWGLPRSLAIFLVDLVAAAAVIWAGATAHIVNPAFASAVGWAPEGVEWTHRGVMIGGVAVIVTSIVEVVMEYRRRGLEAADA